MVSAAGGSGTGGVSFGVRHSAGVCVGVCLGASVGVIWVSDRVSASVSVCVDMFSCVRDSSGGSIRWGGSYVTLGSVI